MESFATAYPVIFSDAGEDHDKGHIGLHSVLNFKKFQEQLSRVVGLPANQLSTVFICTVKDTDKRRKLPIGESTNFNIILNQHNPSRERDCHFLVSLKKSKKERKGGRKKNTEVDDDDSTSSRGDVSPLEQRPKQSQQQQQQHDQLDKVLFPESTSPTSILQRSLSPAVSPPEDAGIQPRHEDAFTENLDKRLLAREQQQQQGGGNRGESVVQRVEGFTLPGAAPKPLAQQQQQQQQLGTHENSRWSSEGSRGLAARVVLNNAPGLAPQSPQQQQQQQIRAQQQQQLLRDRQRFNDAVVRGSAAGAAAYVSSGHNAAWLNTLQGGNNRSLSTQQQQQLLLLQQQQQQQLQQQLQQQYLMGKKAKQPQPEQQQEPLQQQKYICKMCEDASYKGEFHHCVNDEIFKGFKTRRSPAGSIQRPRASHS